jgi:hypothetical protein
MKSFGGPKISRWGGMSEGIQGGLRITQNSHKFLRKLIITSVDGEKEKIQSPQN